MRGTTLVHNRALKPLTQGYGLSYLSDKQLQDHVHTVLWVLLHQTNTLLTTNQATLLVTAISDTIINQGCCDVNKTKRHC